MKSFKQYLNVPTLTPQEIADKHDKPLAYIMHQLHDGTKVEKEHTTKDEVAREIALAHLGELPDYYVRLRKVEKKH